MSVPFRRGIPRGTKRPIPAVQPKPFELDDLVTTAIVKPLALRVVGHRFTSTVSLRVRRGFCGCIGVTLKRSEIPSMSMLPLTPK
jgi:hypothetical protein